MGRATSLANRLASVFLLPGELACNALHVEKANNRDLLRMLINSFVWALVGAGFVAVVA